MTSREKASVRQREIMMQIRAEAQAERSRREQARLAPDVIGLYPADDPPPIPPAKTSCARCTDDAVKSG